MSTQTATPSLPNLVSEKSTAKSEIIRNGQASLDNFIRLFKADKLDVGKELLNILAYCNTNKVVIAENDPVHEFVAEMQWNLQDVVDQALTAYMDVLAPVILQSKARRDTAQATKTPLCFPDPIPKREDDLAN
jgi:hypothetical protein